VSRWQLDQSLEQPWPATSPSAAQAVECTALDCSRVGWTSQARRPCIRVFLACAAFGPLRVRRRNALRRMALAMLGMWHFSLCKSVTCEPSLGGAGTWLGRLGRRPLPRADGFAFSTKRRGFKAGSNGHEEPAGLAYSIGDGPASHVRHQGHPASSSAQTRNKREGPDGVEQTSA
jgi:hypothetical protein